MVCSKLTWGGEMLHLELSFHSPLGWEGFFELCSSTERPNQGFCVTIRVFLGREFRSEVSPQAPPNRGGCKLIFPQHSCSHLSSHQEPQQDGRCFHPCGLQAGAAGRGCRQGLQAGKRQ